MKPTLLVLLPAIGCGNIKGRVLIPPEYSLNDTGSTDPPPALNACETDQSKSYRRLLG